MSNLTNRQIQAVNTKNKIYSAAIKSFINKGFNNVRIKDITDIAGVSKGTFYTHFDSKESIIYEYFNNKNLKNQPANTLYFNIPSINKKIIENEKELYLIALQNAGGNKTKAAKLLGISRTKLYYKLKELGIK